MERDLIEEELDALMTAFSGVAKASYRRGMSIICLICNAERTSTLLERVSGWGRRESCAVGWVAGWLEEGGQRDGAGVACVWWSGSASALGARPAWHHAQQGHIHLPLAFARARRCSRCWGARA